MIFYGFYYITSKLQCIIGIHFYIFPWNQSHDIGIASAMIYQLQKQFLRQKKTKKKKKETQRVWCVKIGQHLPVAIALNSPYGYF